MGTSGYPDAHKAPARCPRQGAEGITVGPKCCITWAAGICPQGDHKGRCGHPCGHPTCCKKLRAPAGTRMPARCPPGELQASLRAPEVLQKWAAGTCGHPDARKMPAGCPQGELRASLRAPEVLQKMGCGHLRASAGTRMPARCPQGELRASLRAPEVLQKIGCGHLRAPAPRLGFTKVKGGGVG